MPWTGPEFKAGHWKDATPAQAAKAARIANGILRGGGDEGIAISTGIARAKGQRRRVRVRARKR